MKNFVLRVSLALVVFAGSASTLRAQTGEVAGGTMDITIDPTLYAIFETHGITMTLGPSLANAMHQDTILSGLFDLGTGKGKFATKGQIKLVGPGGHTVTVTQLGVDTTGAMPVVYGYVYDDMNFLQRQNIFYVHTLTGVLGPMKYGANDGVVMVSLAPNFLTMVGTCFQTSALLSYHGYSTIKTDVELEKLP
jgi:hypothetical protein